MASIRICFTLKDNGGSGIYISHAATPELALKWLAEVYGDRLLFGEVQTKTLTEVLAVPKQ